MLRSSNSSDSSSEAPSDDSVLGEQTKQCSPSPRSCSAGRKRLASSVPQPSNCSNSCGSLETTRPRLFLAQEVGVLAILGTEHYVGPIKHSLSNRRVKRPGKPKRAWCAEGLCSGTGAEALGSKVLLLFSLQFLCGQLI